MGTFGSILILIRFWILIESIVDGRDEWWGNGK